MHALRNIAQQMRRKKIDMNFDDQHMANLDDLVVRTVEQSNVPDLGTLSDSELLYVALASNSKMLLNKAGYTMLQAFDRIGPAWRDHLHAKWVYTNKTALRED